MSAFSPKADVCLRKKQQLVNDDLKRYNRTFLKLGSQMRIPLNHHQTLVSAHVDYLVERKASILDTPATRYYYCFHTLQRYAAVAKQMRPQYITIHTLT